MIAAQAKVPKHLVVAWPVNAVLYLSGAIPEQEKLHAVELAKSQVSQDFEKAAAAKDIEIQKLKNSIEHGEVSQKLAVAEALSLIEKQRDQLANEL